MNDDIFALDGLSTVITGASRGIGFAIARTLLSRGAAVLINGLSVEETTAAAARLKGEFGEHSVAALAGDVSDEGFASELVSAAVDHLGRLDHIVANAGIDIIKPAVDYTAADWDHVIGVNLRGSFLPAQAAARHWIARDQQGSITITSSIAGSVGIPTLAPYAASKGGVNQLVRTLAAEWAPVGIRVNAVAPGYVSNIMESVTAHDAPESDARINTFTPLGRRASVDEIAAPYAFLASRAATYVTGSILAVDGGYTAV
ncbi:SDR family oxidoreductase [Microbacterium trichothecenolyticum]|uniref:SDR family oxidoreductase n=1 Tax=Microbacterium ureisolvens TaxID=2781186 RepID=A0ABS7I2K9_9MICO|nr:MULTISPECIES: SDR family oxidoreductase [Microbacterium]MBW9111891.1 SDR family oxidoreductase [Microbacterium ureisolvens]MBW9122262.1 SDR family oxidoreductase [Microbacterium trichothecenolyticum]